MTKRIGLWLFVLASCLGGALLFANAGNYVFAIILGVCALLSTTQIAVEVRSEIDRRED